MKIKVLKQKLSARIKKRAIKPNMGGMNQSLFKACKGVLISAMLVTSAMPSVSIGSKGNVQIGGFFSQGWLKTEGNNYPIDASGGSFDFREMAVNVSTTVGSNLRLGAQGFAQRLGNYGEDQVILDWAVADYNFRPEIGIRAGRVKFPKGLYGESLDLDMLRPFVFLPGALYNPVTRDFNSSFNGGMIYGSVNAGRGGNFDYKVFYGDIPMSPDQGVADFFNNTGLYAPPGANDLGMDYATGAQLIWNTPATGLRFVASHSYLNKIFGHGKFAFAPTIDIKVFGSKYSYTTVSLEYTRASWTLAAEWEKVEDTFTVTSFGPSQPVTNGTKNWYLSAAYRYNARFEFGSYYSVMKNSYPTAGSPKAQNQLADWALSVRFDLTENVLFKVEYHDIDGRMGIFNTLRTPNPVKKDNSSYIAVKTTVSF